MHAKTAAIAWASSDGQREYHGSCSATIKTVERTLRRLAKRFGVPFNELRIAYEAGPTGFVLARRFLDLGVDTLVAAPTHIPNPTGERIKTDKRDALKLARLHRAGELKGVHIPDREDEMIRDLCHARTDAVEDMRRIKEQLTAFLLRNGHRYSGQTNWTAAHLRYLRHLELPADQRFVLEEYLLALDAAHGRIDRLEAHMAERLDMWNRKPAVERLMGFKGFRIVAAMTLTAELGDLTRFEHPRQLMAYLGLVPGEHSSGSRRRLGAITKCGNSHARWMLVESAKAYRTRPNVSAQLTTRQEGLPREIKILSWRAQRRLCNRYRRLKTRGLHENKAAIAVARELCGFFWESARFQPAH
ncbi:MAG: IS110 family transposase [Verrucomicrobiota bacterium]